MIPLIGIIGVFNMANELWKIRAINEKKKEPDSKLKILNSKACMGCEW